MVVLSKLVTLKNLGQYRDGSDHLVRELKDSLSEVCVEYIDADIYILDEFQRFKELVNRESESDAAEIARRIFAKDKAHIILLSATPFKAYTGDSPWESSEEHYKEFGTILDFLFAGDKEQLKGYENHHARLYSSNASGVGHHARRDRYFPSGRCARCTATSHVPDGETQRVARLQRHDGGQMADAATSCVLWRHPELL